MKIMMMMINGREGRQEHKMSVKCHMCLLGLIILCLLSTGEHIFICTKTGKDLHLDVHKIMFCLLLHST